MWSCFKRSSWEKKKEFLGFPGGPEVKNPPVNAGGVGLVPGPGRPRLLWGN